MIDGCPQFFFLYLIGKNVDYSSLKQLVEAVAALTESAGRKDTKHQTD